MGQVAGKELVFPRLRKDRGPLWRWWHGYCRYRVPMFPVYFHSKIEHEKAAALSGHSAAARIA